MVTVTACGAPRPQGPLGVRAWISILILFLPGLSSVVYAQSNPAPPQATARAAVSLGAAPEVSAIDLLVGRSTVLDVASPIARVSLTSPDVADALVTTPQQVLVHGKTAGTISMFVWDRAGGIRRYEVNVRRDLSELEGQIRQLFPGEPIAVVGNGKDVVISGTVSSKYVVDKAAEVAAGYVEKKDNVVNLMQQQQGVASNQVLLHVRFAEVSRSALQEIGASFVANNYKGDWSARTAPPGVAAPNFEKDGSLTFSDFLNLFVFNSKEGLGGVIRALSTKGLFQSLAEPNLVATNGKEASFLAGGEYPYPVAQSSNGGTNITIQFKEFGVRLSFTPTLLSGDLVHLKVTPEVSALDFSNAITLQGFRIPALTTRRTETEVELHDGQTFAIAGLMNNTLTSTISKIPGIGDIPILGLLFKSRAFQKNQTELVVMITPQILRANSTGAASTLPNLVQPYLPPEQKTLPPPVPYAPQGFVAPSSAPSIAPASGVAAAPAPAPAGAPTTPAAAAVATPAAAPTAIATPAAQPRAELAPRPNVPSKAERKAAEKADREEQKRLAREAKENDKKAREAAKQAAEQAKADARQAEEAQAQEAKLERARASREAELARKADEERQKQEEKERERGKALAEAEARLKAAQAAFQAEVDKATDRAESR
jgi:pilus assembly protein CpaC